MYSIPYLVAHWPPVANHWPPTVTWSTWFQAGHHYMPVANHWLPANTWPAYCHQSLTMKSKWPNRVQISLLLLILYFYKILIIIIRIDHKHYNLKPGTKTKTKTKRSRSKSNYKINATWNHNKSVFVYILSHNRIDNRPHYESKIRHKIVKYQTVVLKRQSNKERWRNYTILKTHL